MPYTLCIWYAASPDDQPQVHVLDEQQVFEYVRPEVGFLSDMIHLQGRGVRKLSLEVNNPEVRAEIADAEVQTGDG